MVRSSASSAFCLVESSLTASVSAMIAVRFSVCRAVISLIGLMVPSEFYGVAAAGRPTLNIGDVTGEIPIILRDADCGCSISVGDVDGLVSRILRLRAGSIDSPQ